ncbi:hypothetical protein [Streptodolium elevatio]
MSDKPAEPVSHADADAAIGRVIRWCRTQLADEQRAAAPDQTRLQRLLDGLAACLADQRRLADADPADLGRIAADYEARLSDLFEA